jgi:membrane-anchored mycosin MYCP
MAMQREPKVKPAPLFDPRGDYYNADVVVALKHLPLLHSVLEENKVLHDVVDHSDLLGLALVRLTDRKAAAEQIIVPLEEAQKKEAREGRTYLDRFLRGLRLRFRQDYAGWTPIVGKNRLVGHVTGGGKISHGGNEPPKVVEDFAPGPREGRSGEGVRVGVLDTSMSRNEWLLGGWTADPDDVLRAGGKVRAVAGHATFVTGLVLHQAPACQVLVRKVLTDDYGEAESWSVAKAIVEIGRAGVDVLNLSLVCYTEDGEPPLVLATALDRLPR